MLYSAEELEILLDKIGDRMRAKITLANREDRLLEILKDFGMEDLITGLPREPEVEHSRMGNILVVGDCAAGKDLLRGVAKDMRISKKRLIFWDFDEAKASRFQTRIQNKGIYAVILFGPTGHSGKGKGDYSSQLSFLEQEDGFPPVRRMEDNSQSNNLKITKSNFREALARLIQDDIVKVDLPEKVA